MAMFISKKRELRIIVKPADRTFDEARRPIIIRGERIEFRNFRFATEDPSLIEWLKQHPLCGTQFICADEGTAKAQPKLDRPAVPELIHGTMTTAGKTIDDEGNKVIEVAPQVISYETPITKDEIMIMIDQKLDDFFKQIVSVVQSQAASKVDIPVPKRTFKCPHCDEVFRSGVEVGKHKKLAHLDKI